MTQQLRLVSPDKPEDLSHHDIQAFDKTLKFHLKVSECGNPLLVWRYKPALPPELAGTPEAFQEMIASERTAISLVVKLAWWEKLLRRSLERKILREIVSVKKKVADAERKSRAAKENVERLLQKVADVERASRKEPS